MLLVLLIRALVLILSKVDILSFSAKRCPLGGVKRGRELLLNYLGDSNFLFSRPSPCEHVPP
jgi:hypothetical protein